MQGIRGKQIIQVFLVVLLSIFTLLLTVSEVYAVRRLGCVKAVCMDGCKNFGNQSYCNSSKTCKYGNMDDPSPNTDGFTCNSLYLSTSSPLSQSINYCSPTPIGSEQICVDSWGPEKPCYDVVWCACYHDERLNKDSCKETDVTTPPFDSDDCETPVWPPTN